MMYAAAGYVLERLSGALKQVDPSGEFVSPRQ